MSELIRHNGRSIRGRHAAKIEPVSDLDRDGIQLKNVHHHDACSHRECVIHNPTDHHMRPWRLHWRDDRGIFERICPHGIGHPDPDQWGYWLETDQIYQSVHGCDGCC